MYLHCSPIGWFSQYVSLNKLFREDTEEEPAGADETIEEEAIDDNNNEAPAIVFEQQELPRNLGK